jgi:hypothetical protein
MAHDPWPWRPVQPSPSLSRRGPAWTTRRAAPAWRARSRPLQPGTTRLAAMARIWPRRGRPSRGRLVSAAPWRKRPLPPRGGAPDQPRRAAPPAPALRSRDDPAPSAQRGLAPPLASPWPRSWLARGRSSRRGARPAQLGVLGAAVRGTHSAAARDRPPARPARGTRPPSCPRGVACCVQHCQLGRGSLAAACAAHLPTTHTRGQLDGLLNQRDQARSNPMHRGMWRCSRDDTHVLVPFLCVVSCGDSPHHLKFLVLCQ